MATAANLRARIEATLSNRFPAAFSPKIKPPPELFSTGIVDADAILEGGIPRGSITEISGAASTGRTSFTLSIIAGITRSGAACAWVDVHDALSPESAASAGVVLERLLWLRTRPVSTERQVDECAPCQLSLPAISEPQSIHHGGGSRHPRNETRGMDSAVSLLFKGEGGLLRDKTNGTPGRSNRPLSEPRCAEPLQRVQRNELVAYDRLPARRGECFLNESAKDELTRTLHPSSRPQRSADEKRWPEKPWPRLEQALKATDLLLQAGGFAAIVLDMCELLPQHTTRITLATWYRFRLAAEQARTALILLTQSPCSNNCAALVLRCEPAPSETWSDNGKTSLFEGQHYELTMVRNRNEASAYTPKKPPERAAWHAQTEWKKVR